MAIQPVHYPWSRIIHFIALEDSLPYFGEPTDAELDIGASLASSPPVEVTAWVLNGTAAWKITGRSGEVRKVARLLSPVLTLGDEDAEHAQPIRCVGLNYKDHAAELGLPLPSYPEIFLKPPTALHHPNSVIPIPAMAQLHQVDYEVELAVVISKTCRDVREHDAWDFVLGYTIANDLTARGVQDWGTQWTFCKGFDKFCPIGPCIVSARGSGGRFDPHRLKLQTHLNGKLMQDGSSAQMIFSIPRIIAHMSQGTTLPAGTVILTGTPPGIGASKDPKVWLRDGDEAPRDDSLHNALASIITGTENPPPASSSSGSSSRSTIDDDLTPFPSPMLSATGLAGLSLSSDGELEAEFDEDRIVSDEEREKSQELKAEANKAFAAKNFLLSTDLYTQAIALNPKDATFWNNRGMSKSRMEEHGGAIADASKAIELNPTYAKAYYRRGLSYLAILRPTDAVSSFKSALKLEPGNASIRSQLDATVKLIRRIEFEKAISMGETESAASKCNTAISQGACGMDTTSLPADFPLPSIPSDPNARFSAPTPEFVSAMIKLFKEGGKLPKRLAWEIILGVSDIVLKERTMIDRIVGEGVVCDVVGDTHGQFFDVCNLLDKIGLPSDTHMIVFNGDLVDRGSWSVEVALTAFALKWTWPDRVCINRGNHETNDMNKVYGFEGEAKAKYGEMTYKLFADVFTSLPLATLLSASQSPSSLKSEGSKPAILSEEGKKRYFVCHGGPPVSKDGVTLEEVAKLDRFGRQPGQEGLMCEILWTDPQEQQGRGPSKRGVGLGFGPDVTRRWCELNKVTAVIRSHEVRQDGYAIEHDGLCITTFSCPNYCDTTGNKAAWVRMQGDGQLSYHQFEAVPHPNVKPMQYASGFGFMNGM